MKVFKKEYIKDGGTVLALGSFDAIHTAHQKIIKKAIQYGKENGLKSGVYQFLTQPCEVLNPKEFKGNVYTNAQKEVILESLGVDFAYFEDFSEEFIKLSPESFIKELCEKFDVKCVVVGFHYRFGYKGEGDSELLKKLGEKYGFETIIVCPVKKDGTLISSTLIRNYILSGEIKKANAFLGREYSILTEVKKDRGVGTSVLNIATANLTLEKNLVLPENGVYLTKVIYDNKAYPAVTNVGTRPTFDLDEKTVETHILDFKEDIYGKKIEVLFLEQIRKEVKFQNSDQLKMQILSDIDKARMMSKNNFLL